MEEYKEELNLQEELHSIIRSLFLPRDLKNLAKRQYNNWYVSFWIATRNVMSSLGWTEDHRVCTTSAWIVHAVTGVSSFEPDLGAIIISLLEKYYTAR